jgi:excisionase family DNA binding protein
VAEVKEQEQLLLASQVAEQLQVSTETVRDWAANGDLRCVRIGTNGRWLRFRPADVDAFIKARRSA